MLHLLSSSLHLNVKHGPRPIIKYVPGCLERKRAGLGCARGRGWEGGVGPEPSPLLFVCSEAPVTVESSKPQQEACVT